MATFVNALSSVFAKYTGRGQTAASDIDRAFDELCKAPRDQKTNVRLRIPDAKFTVISDLLKHYEDRKNLEGWHHRPRIFTVLHEIRRHDAMEAFISASLTDSCIPFEADTLPDVLGSSKHKFMQLQDTVLTPAKDLELGMGGKHRYFSSTGDDHFQKLKYLGSGGYGEVEKVYSRLSLKVYARKKFRRTGGFRVSVDRLKQFEREITALKRLRHTHLIDIVGSYTDRNSFAFLMVPVADCNLLDFLNRRASTELPTLRSFYGCLANAIAYLHGEKVHHMDLKPENMLIKDGELYVADFGSAHDWSKKERSTTYSSLPRTPRYTPPELIKDPNGPRNGATDIWALGVVFLEMTTVLKGLSIKEFRDYLRTNGSGHPFVHDNSPATASWTEILQQSEGLDSDNEPLMWIYGMIRSSPRDRPTASQVFELIIESSAGEHFRRSCCAKPHSEQTTESWAVDGWSKELDDNVLDEDSLIIQTLLSPSTDPSGGQFSSVEAWLSRGDTFQENNLEKAGIVERSEGIPFEISEDVIDEPPKAPQTIPDGSSSYLHKYDFLEKPPVVPGAWAGWEDDDANSLPYEVSSDCALSEFSEATLRPFEILEDITLKLKSQQQVV